MDKKLEEELALHRAKKQALLDKEKAKTLALRKRSTGKDHKHYTDKNKIIALQTYAQTGSWVIAARESGIGYDYLRIQIAKTQWWKDSLKEVRSEEDDVLDGDLSEIIKDGVTQLKDRVKHGDWMWNSKENKFVRKALNAQTLQKITTGFMDQRNVLRGKPTRITEQVSMNDRLAKLASAFENFQTSRTLEAFKAPEVEDAEIIEESYGDETELQEGIRELPREAGTDQESERAQLSAGDDGEGWKGI